jgi:nicotinamidase-related amidase
MQGRCLSVFYNGASRPCASRAGHRSLKGTLGLNVDTHQLALLLVDIQRDFWRPLASEPQCAPFPANVAALLATARMHQLPIIHTHACFAADGSDWMLFYRPHGRGNIPCIAGTSGVAVEDFAAPAEGEPIVLKKSFDGFSATGLEHELRVRNIRAVLIAGLVTSVCVLFTATSAYVRRFVPIVVSDACADVPADHDATLRRYAGLCFQSATTGQVQCELPSVLRLAERFAADSCSLVGV